MNFRCIYNEFLFTQIICNSNQSNRYIICCSDQDYCNDRDQYSNDIRKQLLELGNSERKYYLIKLIVLIAGSIIILFLFLISFILFRIKRRKYVLKIILKIKFSFVNRRNSSNYIKPNQSNKNQFLFKYLFRRSKSSISDVKTDEISTGSSGCGRFSENNKLFGPFLDRRDITKDIKLEERIGIGGYGCVYRGKWDGDIYAVKIFLSSEEPSWGREVEIYNTPGLNHDNILRYIAASRTVMKVSR